MAFFFSFLIIILIFFIWDELLGTWTLEGVRETSAFLCMGLRWGETEKEQKVSDRSEPYIRGLLCCKTQWIWYFGVVVYIKA